MDTLTLMLKQPEPAAQRAEMFGAVYLVLCALILYEEVVAVRRAGHEVGELTDTRTSCLVPAATHGLTLI